MTMNKLLALLGFIYKMEMITHTAAVSKPTYSRLQNTKHYAGTLLIPCLLSRIHTPKPITMAFPSLMSFLVMSQVYLTLLLMTKKKKLTAPKPQSSQAGFLFPCVLQYYLRNNIEGTIPVTVS